MQSTSFSAGNLHTYHRGIFINFFPLTKQFSAVIKQLIKLVIGFLWRHDKKVNEQAVL